MAAKNACMNKSAVQLKNRAPWTCTASGFANVPFTMGGMKVREEPARTSSPNKTTSDELSTVR